MLSSNIEYFKSKPVNIPKVTILLDHGYHKDLIQVALERVYPGIMKKIRLEHSAKPSKAEKVACGKSGFVPVRMRWVIERTNSWVERCKRPCPSGASYGQEKFGEEFRVEFRKCEGKSGCVFYSVDVGAVGSIMKRPQMGSIGDVVAVHRINAKQPSCRKQTRQAVPFSANKRIESPEITQDSIAEYAAANRWFRF